MALTKLIAEVNNIQTLADQPTETAVVIKQKFDKAGADIKTYINNTLTEEIDNTLATKQEVLDAVAGAVPAGSVTDVYLSNAAGNIKQTVSTHLVDEANAHGGVDASSILTKIKTVDGTGTGLDADLLDGKHATSFQEVKTRGSVIYTDALTASATLQKTIPLGKTYKEAVLYVLSNGTAANKAVLFCNTDSTLTFCIGKVTATSGIQQTFRKVDTALISGAQSTALGVGYVNLLDAYISGTNLILELKNSDTSATRTLDTTIHWEAW